ncbi:MAG: radical SAM protein, partial [Deltaproteobacteria bacterium]|nr:radical SAM protein [Deltaproteobacteria bacterium]
IYERAWHLYYSPEHIETLFKRTVACGASTARLAAMIFDFYGSHAFERVHPLQSGLIRRKVRRQRRSGLPREKLLPFSIRRVREIFSTYVPALWFRLKLESTRRRIMNDPTSTTYTDLALSPVEDDLESDKLGLLQNTEAARRVTQQARLKAAALQRVEERRAV